IGVFNFQRINVPCGILRVCGEGVSSLTLEKLKVRTKQTDARARIGWTEVRLHIQRERLADQGNRFHDNRARRGCGKTVQNRTLLICCRSRLAPAHSDQKSRAHQAWESPLQTGSTVSHKGTLSRQD